MGCTAGITQYILPRALLVLRHDAQYCLSRPNVHVCVGDSRLNIQSLEN